MSDAPKPRVLIVDDYSNWRNLLADLLKDEYDVATADSYETALKMLSSQDLPFLTAIIDISFDDRNPADDKGLRLIEEFNSQTEFMHFIVVTGHATVRTVREAFRDLAVFDYIEKYPSNGGYFDWRGFRDVVRKATEDAALKRGRRVYVALSLEDVLPGVPLEAGRHYTLILALEETATEDSLMISINKFSETTAEVTIDAADMKVQPGEIRFWTIPAGGTPESLRTVLIPKSPGRQHISIYLRVNERPLRGLEKEVEVIRVAAKNRQED